MILEFRKEGSLGNSMKGNIQLLQSGISLVDQAWGGFYKGGTYLLIGPRKSGRTLLGLQYAMEATKQKEVCLYFTNMRPKDLMIHASSINFDLQTYMDQNLILVVRVSPPTDLYDLRNPDEYLVEYLKDISTVVDQFAPSRIIFDEITPYIGFSNMDLLKDTFLQILENNEQKDITSLFIIGEPATPLAQNIVDIIVHFVTATIYLQKKALITDAKSNLGKMIITPNVGHTEGQFYSNYMIEPYKGVVTDYKPAEWLHNENTERPEESQGTFNKQQFQPSHQLIPQVMPVNQIKPPAKDSLYTSLSSLDTPPEPYSFSNLYEYNDFLLLLNNQIALYKSTGQIFNLVSFKLDTEAERAGLLTVNQLQNAIRLASDKKDKICISDNKVIVLLIRSDKKALSALISKIQSNLPGNGPNYLKTVLQYISVLSIEVDENVENAESLMNYVNGQDKNTRNQINSYNRQNPFQ
ncbi:MAG: RAD55 family ATPase [Ignavibacteria bacterium]